LETAKKETPLLEQDEPQGTTNTQIISPTKPIVNPDATTWIADMRRDKNLRANEVTAVIKSHRSKFDAALYSKIERPGEYGVQLVPSVAKIVQAAFGYEPRRSRRSDNRTLPCRVSFRLSPEEYAGLQRAISVDGFDTMQAWGRATAMQYIKDMKAGGAL